MKKNNEKMKVLLYVRSATNSEQNLLLQENQLKEYAKFCGFENTKILRQVGSGVCKKRFRKMKSEFLNTKPNMIVVTSYQVLTREYNQMMELLHTLTINGIDLRVLSLPPEYFDVKKLRKFLRTVITNSSRLIRMEKRKKIKKKQIVKPKNK